MEPESSVQIIGTTCTLAEKQNVQHLEDMKQKENKELEFSNQGNKRKLESVIEKKKKRSKQHRLLKTTLAILKPDSQTVQEEKAANFAQAYFWKVKRRLPETAFSHFVQELVSFETKKSKNVSDLYKEVESLLTPHTDLIDEFLVFLLPHQALEVGRFIDYILLTKMKEFFTKLEGCLLPKQVQQILTTLEHLAGIPNVTLCDVRNGLLPHLKSSTLLSDYFLALLPGEHPPDSLQQLTECEHLDCSDEHNTECVETILVPDCYDPYGGENCPCACHISQVVHCTSCGVKFINGRIYMQYGKILRPAKVVFKGENQSEMLETKWRFVGNSKARTQAYKRIHPSPFKSHTSHSYDDHRMGTESEDDFSLEHGKTSLANKKSPKTARIRSNIGSKQKNITKSANRKEESIVKEISSIVEGVTPLAAENCQEQLEISKNQLFPNKKDSTSSLILCSKKCETVKDVTVEIVDFVKTNDLCVQKEIMVKENFKKTRFENVMGDKVNKNNEKEILLVPIKVKFETDGTGSCVDDMASQDKKPEENVQDPIFDPDNSSRCAKEWDESVIDDMMCKQSRLTEVSASSQKVENFDQIRISKVANQEDHIVRSEDIGNYTEENQIITEENEKTTSSDNSITNCTNISEDSSSENKSDLNMDEVSCQNAETEISKDSGSSKGELKISSSLGNLESKASKNIKVAEVLSWTREEDKVILQAFQQENDTEQIFNKINQRLSNRTVEEIQSRFQMLMQLLKEMTSVSPDGNLQC